MKTAILLIDHGSRREKANLMLNDVGDLLQSMRPDLIIEIAHMELAEPTIEQGFAACVRRGAEYVIVHPYMLSPGRHAGKDIPIMASAAAKQFPDVKWRCTQPLGIHEKIAEVILERAFNPQPSARKPEPATAQ